MTLPDRKTDQPSTIDKILKTLSTLNISGKLIVFGSTADGKPAPGDVDICIDMRPMTLSAFNSNTPAHSSVAPLLRIAISKYGFFDPFLLFSENNEGQKDSNRHLPREAS